jgi:hypothetical protein
MSKKPVTKKAAAATPAKKPVAKSKASVSFRDAIQSYLNLRAFQDPLFAASLKKEGKSIDECLNYIMETVKKSGQQGFEDSEVYNMAVHYYDEDDIKVGSGVSGNVVVNHAVALTPEEIQEMKNKVVEDTKAELTDDEVKRQKKILLDEIISQEKSKLTDDDIKKAKAKALRLVVKEAKEKMTTKVAPKPVTETKTPTDLFS